MYQELTIVGTMGRDPEMRYTPEGKPTASFSVATNRNTAKGDRETTWFQVTCWDKAAEYMGKFSQKGTRVLVRGRLVVDPVSGGPRVFKRQDGTASSAFEVVADTVRVISGHKQMEGQEYVQAQPTQRTEPTQQNFDIDIPF